ncbi:MAG: hypothetical protein AAFX01_01365 [Cyanobacteria bacterium J06638_28]
MNLPTLLSDRQIRPLEYTCEGEPCSGVSADGRSYVLMSSFPAEDRSLAYEKGCEMAEQVEDVVLTASVGIRPLYRLWVAVSQKDCQTQKSTDTANHQSSSTASCESTPEASLLAHTSHRQFLQYVKV